MYRRYLIGLVFAVVFGAALLAGGGWSTPSATGATVPPVPAVNDNFVDATDIGNLPFNRQADIRLATLETGEPGPTCGYGNYDNTVWYRFQPSQNTTIKAKVRANMYWGGAFAIYTGSALNNLSQVGCREFYYYGEESLTIQAQAGVAYYIQIGGLSGQKGTFSFTLEEAPPPIIDSIYANPSEPSVYDDVDFSAYGWDPAYFGIVSWLWDFGDGDTADTQYTKHQYDEDGEYSVRLDVETADGRTATAYKDPFVVKTHDVVLTNFRGPSKGRVGKTAEIKVGIHNERYPENVSVLLYRSVPGGFEEVGSLTQHVPVHNGRRETTDFYFSYTFSPDDVAIGKLTLKVVAVVVDGRDALPADNAYITWPVKVEAEDGSGTHQQFNFEYQEFVREVNTLFMPIISQ